MSLFGYSLDFLMSLCMEHLRLGGAIGEGGYLQRFGAIPPPPLAPSPPLEPMGPVYIMYAYTGRL